MLLILLKKEILILLQLENGLYCHPDLQVALVTCNKIIKIVGLFAENLEARICSLLSHAIHSGQKIKEYCDKVPHCIPADKPDVMARVFKIKLELLLEDFTENHVLGKVIGGNYLFEAIFLSVHIALQVCLIM